MSSRYTSFDWQSSISSSAELKRPKSLLRNTKSNDSAMVKVKNEQNFASMVKKFMEKKSSKAGKGGDRAMPADFIAEDLKKVVSKKGSNLSALPRKIFGKGSEKSRSSEVVKAKALTEVKANTRTLAMVLRSERELLTLNKEQESHIVQLKSLLHDRTTEVEKLKDLCLKQREEIKALKSAILFPDDMNSQLQELLDQQGSELKQAKRIIPTLQRQISSLTGQIQCLSEDLAEVKAVNYKTRSIDDGFSTPRTPEAANSLDDPFLDSPDNMLLKDVNPCLTPCYSKMKSKEYEGVNYSYSKDEAIYGGNAAARKLSRSSDHYTILRPEIEAFCMSDEGRYRYRNPIDRLLI